MAVFYYELEVGNEEVVKIGWNACFFFIPFTLLIMCIFFMNIEKEYRHTFYSSESGKHVTLAYFKSREDSVKIIVFESNERHWREIDEKLKMWVTENWARWMEEEPEWLNDNMKARVPPHMIPNIKDRQKVEVLQSARRRSSLLGRISGRRRSSFTGADKVTPD